MPWDPDRYLRFADHRTRPGIELLSRVPDFDAYRVVDLGCGTGHLTAMLQERWPDAIIIGIDSSEEMIERARADHPDMTWVVGDVETWSPEEPIDLIFSNATLHWIDGHQNLFPRLRSLLDPGGVLAVQMPDNWNAPTHRIPARVLNDGDWPTGARAALMRDRLSRPGDYAQWVQPASVDLWRTTYYQRLTGGDPVWEWVTGSVLRPVLAELDPPELARFVADCRSHYQTEYPSDPSGITTLPFSRLFMVARVPATRHRV